MQPNVFKEINEMIANAPKDKPPSIQFVSFIYQQAMAIQNLEHKLLQCEEKLKLVSNNEYELQSQLKKEKDENQEKEKAIRFIVDEKIEKINTLMEKMYQERPSISIEPTYVKNTY